jgi:signal transduction histidine kinase
MEHMRISIKLRTIILTNLLVIGVCVMFGRLAGEVAGRVVEERLAGELAKNASSFLRDRKLPFDVPGPSSDSLMKSLSRILGVEAATFRGPGVQLIGSSMAPAKTEQLRVQIADLLAGGGSARTGLAWPVGDAGQTAGQDDEALGYVTLDGASYRVQSHQIASPGSEGVPQQFRLCLVVPARQFEEARNKATQRVSGLTLPAIGVATLLAFVMSITITRPISKLSKQVKGLSQEAISGGAGVSPVGLSADLAHEQAQEIHGRDAHATGGLLKIGRGPSEVARLAEAFNGLLTSLREAQGKLAESQRLAALGTMAASVAHELRNPLSGLKMNLRVLRDELPEHHSSDESLQVALREIDRMDLYLQELLSLAAPDGAIADSGSGLADASPKPESPIAGPTSAVSLAELTGSVMLLLEGRCRHEGIEVKRDYSQAPEVLADGGKIRQVIMNLILNAIQAQPGGGTVSLCVRPAGAGWVRFSVADTGKGVAGDNDIFAPFVTTKPGSTGLGLHLCKKIIDEQGGKIGYESSDGGACFWFELPSAGENDEIRMTNDE